MADIFTTILNGIQKKFADLGTHHAEVVVVVNEDGSPVVGCGPTEDLAREATQQQVRDRLPATMLTPGLLPVDSLGTPGIPRVQATSATAANIALTTTCRRVSMYATAGAWYSISGTATTSSHFIAEGERLDFDVPANTTISVLQDTSAGSIRVTELA